MQQMSSMRTACCWPSSLLSDESMKQPWVRSELMWSWDDMLTVDGGQWTGMSAWPDRCHMDRLPDGIHPELQVSVSFRIGMPARPFCTCRRTMAAR